MALFDEIRKRIGTLEGKIKAVENIIEELETYNKYYRKNIIVNQKKIDELQSELDHLKFKLRK